MLSYMKGLCTLPIVFIMLTARKEMALGGGARERKLVSPELLMAWSYSLAIRLDRENISPSVC